MTRRALSTALLALGLATFGVFFWRWVAYPSDRTPEGAYLRVVSAVNRDRPEEFFAYLETQAQHACFTIRDYRRKARDRISTAYPEPERTRLVERFADVARAPDGSDVFALRARELGWLSRLREDLSGIAKVEVQGERATVETARGTRYSFRRRENGIWGLTMFTAALVAEAEKAARDYSIIDQAARDYDHARSVAAP